MNEIKNFSTIFISLILEGFPFLILGALVSSIIQLMISEDTIGKLRFKSKFFSLLSMAVAGVLFPVCECAIVPIMRRLVRKGMPIGMAITFMTAVPIVNPVVFMSTYYGFLGYSHIAYLRFALGIVCSVVIGYLIGELTTGNPLRDNKHLHEHDNCCCHDHHHHQEEHHNHAHNNDSIIRKIVGHVSEEFYEIGRFFIIGASISSVFQAFIPREYILRIGGGTVSSIVVMMLLAFILSVCSETDAFIARTFYNQFTGNSVIAFLIFGPMIDIKNTVMLLSNFKFKFVVKLIFVITAVCFLTAAAISILPIKI